MNELQIFKNEEFGEIRTLQLNNEIYFVGKDVAIVLGYTNPRKAIIDHVDEEDKTDGVTIRDSIGREQNPVCINESGLYSLILSSKLESAKRFKRWVTSEVLPTLRKTGSYEMSRTEKKVKVEHLASVNNAVKILTPLLEAAGCNPEIQLLTAKSLYEKAGVSLPLEIHADKHYVDTVHIARHVGLYYQKSGKPADKAVNEIIRRLNLPETMYTETWESKGNWQGAVRKYDEAVIGMVRQWYCNNGYPREIEYTQCDGQVKCYHVMWRDMEVA